MLVACAAAGCARPGGWEDAQAAWTRREPGAWAAWRALDPRTPEGAEAHRRMGAADAHYRRGVALFAAGDPEARAALEAGVALAPMDPSLYLPLARAARDRHLTARAAELYRKYLSTEPADGDAIRAELAALDASELSVLDGIEPPGPPASRRWPVPAGVAAAGLAVLALAAARRRPRRRRLCELAAESPELQPAIAYLVGVLRHELLKHRIGAVTAALDGLPASEPAQRAFLLRRLYAGEPLQVAWAGHLGTFLRALGPRFDVGRTDPAFRDAGRAVAEIASLQGALRAGDPAAAARLSAACARLSAFDRYLATLLAGFTHTIIDEALLRRLADAVRAEHAVAQVALDALEIAPLPAGVPVDAYQIDVVLVLKNVLRNAILAAGRGPAPRRVAVDVSVVVEPTGEESVRLCVSDSSPEPVALEQLRAQRPERGLGIVGAALERAGGGLDLGTPRPGYAKAVVVRLFRSQRAPASEAAA